MANIKSAKKRVLVNKRQKEENRYIKASLNTEIKKFRLAIAEGNFAAAEAQLKVVESDIMSAKSKGILHANTASRKVSRLKAALSSAQATTEVKEEVKVEEVKEEVKAPAKKTTTKKAETTEEAPAKKAPAKKTTTKTTTAKKTTTKKAE